MRNKNGTLFTLGAVGAPVVTAQALSGGSRGRGSRSLLDDLLEAGGKKKPEVRRERSTVADALIPVDEPGTAWKPEPWVSLRPIEGYAGGGPVLLFGLKNPSGPQMSGGSVTDTGIIAPGYPGLKVLKRSSTYQLVRPVASRDRTARTNYVAQNHGNISGYPDRRRVGEASQVMYALTGILDEAPGDDAKVEVLQAIGLLIGWRRNPLPEAGALETAVARYLQRSGALVPEYITSVIEDVERTQIVVERSYESAPRYLSRSQLQSGGSQDALLVKTVGAALRKNLTAGWTDKAPSGAPTIWPKYTRNGKVSTFVSDGTYALREDAATWLAENTPLGRPRSKPAAKPWLKDETPPNLNDIISGIHPEELRLVGLGTVAGVGPAVVLQTKGGVEIVLATHKFATVLARALHAGNQIDLTSRGHPLDPVLVTVQTLKPGGTTTFELEGVIMPLRIN